jgi:2'-5' RNA ligase
MTDSLRLFVAIKITERLVEELQRLQSRLAARSADRLVRWTRPEQLHLTLRFLGNVESDRLGELKAALEAACQGSSPFGLGLKGLGCFPPQGAPRVIWVGLVGELDRLGALQSRVEAACGGFGEPQQARPFSPHLTLGRVKLRDRRGAAGLARLIGETEVSKLGDWEADRVFLIHSILSAQGASYRDLAEFPLPQTD